MGWGRVPCAVLVFAIWGGTASPEEQASWRGFYSLKTVERTEPDTKTPANAGVCLEAILKAQDRYNIPDNILLAIGIQEAGRRIDGKLAVWPWTANARGKGVFLNSKKALEAWVRGTQAAGTQSIDVGCMQVNQKWHARQFASLEEATDPKANVDYAARFLLNLYGETRDWWQAAGRYHSSTETYKAIYLNKLVQSQKLANDHLGNFAKVAPGNKTPLVQVTATSWHSPAINWTSDMTGTNTVGARKVMSIYSSSPLRAVLPNYAEAD